MKESKAIVPIILWDGDDEIITCQSWVMRGDLDGQLISLLENTAVYRDLLLRDPVIKQTADVNQQRLVDRGYRCLTERLVQIEEPLAAILRISQINLAIEQCRN